MSLTVVYIELGILILGIIIIIGLFIFGVYPFNQPAEFRDPRTWQNVPNNQTWLTPSFDYGPYNRDIPDINIKTVYCAADIDPNRCITSTQQYQQIVTTPPTSC